MANIDSVFDCHMCGIAVDSALPSRLVAEKPGLHGQRKKRGAIISCLDKAPHRCRRPFAQ